MTDITADYYATRSLVQDALKRGDANALDVAVSLHKDALAAIKAAIRFVNPPLSTAVDTSPTEAIR